MAFILFVSLVTLYHLLLSISTSFAVLFLRHGKRRTFVEKAAIATANFLFACGRKIIPTLEERGTTAIPSQCVIVANHQSFLDIYMLLKTFTTNGLRFVAKQELARAVPGVSEVLRYGRHCLINRNAQFRETTDQLKSFALRSVEQKLSPCIFPEGTRSSDGELRTFNSGAYRILQSQLMLPTVVVAVDGGWTFSHLGDFLRKNMYTYRMRILAVLPAPRNKQAILHDLQHAHKLIADHLRQWRA